VPWASSGNLNFVTVRVYYIVTVDADVCIDNDVLVKGGKNHNDAGDFWNAQCYPVVL
jgi:hypothetical protein